MPISFGPICLSLVNGFLEERTQFKNLFRPGKSLPSARALPRGRDVPISKMGKRDNGAPTPDPKFEVEDVNRRC